MAEVYDDSPFFAGNSDAMVRYYKKACQEFGDVVLELASATGTVTVPLAQSGLEVYAVDISQPMLEVLRTKLAHQSSEVRERVHIRCGDILTYVPETKVPVVILAGNALFALPTLADQLRALHTAWKSLDESGTLLLDVFSPNRSLLERLTDVQWSMFTVSQSGRRYLSQRFTTVDPLAQLINLTVVHEVVLEGMLGARYVDELRFRYLYPAELCLALQTVGFEIEHLYGSFDRKPKAEYEDRTIVVARKVNRGT